MSDTPNRENLHEWVKPMENLSITVYQYGYETCPPGHSFGPAVRDHFLLHFVRAGKGVFSAENRAYTLAAGEGFLISPERVTAYRADKTDPWKYFWIGFSGGGAAALLAEIGLDAEKAIFTLSSVDECEKIFDRISAPAADGITGQLELLSALYALLARIRPYSDVQSDSAYRLFNTGSDYAESAERYIRQCYASRITVGGVAEHLGLSRTYFSTIFKKYTGRSPQEYLIYVRIGKAKELLAESDLAVADVARTVGYDDPLLFSRIFHKVCGMSPRAYRMQNGGYAVEEHVFSTL